MKKTAWYDDEYSLEFSTEHGQLYCVLCKTVKTSDSLLTAFQAPVWEGTFQICFDCLRAIVARDENQTQGREES